MSNANNLVRSLGSDLDQSFQLLKTIPIWVRILVPVLYVLSIPVENYWGFNFDTSLIRFGVASTLMLLVFQKFWPTKLLKYGTIIWIVIVTLSLPFTYGAIVLLNAATEPVGNDLNLLPITEYSICLFFMIQILRSTFLTLFSWVMGTLLACATLVLIEQPNTSLVLESVSYTLPFIVTIFTLGGIVHNALVENQKDKEESIWRIATSIAHQLRTPLATIQNLSIGASTHLDPLVSGYKLAKEAGLETEDINPKKVGQIEAVFRDIVAESESAKKLIDILIANSRPANTKSNNLEILRINALIEQAIQTFPYNSPSERARIAFSGSDFQVYADRQLLLHVFYNLIANAVEFAQKKPGGVINIHTKSGVNWNTVSVHDTGVGIPRAHIDLVFDPFFSYDSMNGTGIGLPFCKSVVQSIGGEISVESTQNESTTFTLRFPNASHQKPSEH